jgi:pSer/pThr/pTyr-binding forkhead associated (FHA) protein
VRKSLARTGIEAPGRWLFFVDDDGAVLRFRVGSEEEAGAGRVNIGSDPRNDIFFEHPQVPARALVVVEREGADVVKVYDGARVALNGVVVTGMHRLYSGDRLHVGDHVFLYTRDDTPPDLALGLTVLFGGEVQKAVVLRQTRMLVGRSGDLVLDDPSVDEQHAMLECYADEAIFVKHLGGALGTSVDGEPISGRARVQDGTILQIGRVTVLVRVLASDGLGLLLPPKKKPERIDARFAEPDPAMVASDSGEIPVTVIGSLADLSPQPVSLDELQDSDPFEDEETGRYAPTDRSRPAHWSSGQPAAPVQRRAPAAPPRNEQRPARVAADDPDAPSVRLRSDLVAEPDRPRRIVDGPARPSGPAPSELPHMVTIVKPGLHEAETATLDTRGVPDMIEAHFRAKGQKVPQWAQTGAQAQAPSSPRQPAPLTPPPVHRTAPYADPDAPTQEPIRAPRQNAPARQTGGHERYRPSQGVAPAPVQPAAAGPQLTVAMAPVPDAPRYQAEAAPDPALEQRRRVAEARAARTGQPAPAAAPQGYSHHDPQRLANAERGPEPDPRPLGPTDDARRHLQRRNVDDSPRYRPGEPDPKR